jgi:phosphoenolpyruvate carboxykinase (ATP)
MSNQVAKIKELGLDQLGIEHAEAIYANPSYDELFQHESEYDGSDYGRAVVTDLGAVSVDTGAFTGRSPKDKYIVKHP